LKDILLNLLKKEQDKKGYISEEALKRISKEHGIPISRLWGVVTFYAMLHTEKQGKHVIHVCNSPSCFVNNSLNLLSYLKKRLGIKLDQTTKDGKFSLYASSCIGCCDEAPAMMIDGKAYTKLDEKKIDDILAGMRS